VHRILIFERMGTGYFSGCEIKSRKSTLQPRSGDRLGDRHRSEPVPYLPAPCQIQSAAVLLYERLLASPTRHAALFKALVEEERRHKHRLELQYALLKSRSTRP